MNRAFSQALWARSAALIGLVAVSVVGMTSLVGCDSESAGPSSATPGDGEPAVEPASPDAVAPAAAEAPGAYGAEMPPNPGSACPDGVAVGASFEVACNTCKCTEQGVTGCTYIDCAAHAKAQEKLNIRCEGGRHAGETWKQACNSCSCSDEGKSQCTLMHCGDDAERSCAGGRAVGESWKQDCNECHCTAEFAIACTEKACG